MIDHIYGRLDLLKSKARPHMFVNEMMLYVDFLKVELRRTRLKLSAHPPAYFQDFRANLIRGVEFYRERVTERLRHGRESFEEGLQALVDELESISLPVLVPQAAS